MPKGRLLDADGRGLMERFRSAALAGIAVFGALATAACGAQARDAAVARPQVGAGASVTASVKPTPSVPPSIPRGPLPVSGACTTAQLSISPSGRRTVTGLDVERFLATNTSQLACSLTGSPVLTPVGPLSSSATTTSDIAVSQQDFDGDDEGDASDVHVDLQPGQAAAFDFAWWPASTVVCEQASGFGFRAPGDPDWSTARQVPYAFGSMCDGLFYVSTIRAADATSGG
jgi:hypothetical protein